MRRDIEPGWVSWYIKTYYPNEEVRLRCPLGPIPDELTALYGPAKAAGVYRPWRPEVDAVVVLPGAILLLEAKLFKYMDGLAKLPVYASLVKTTPELKVLLPRPIIMRLLLPTAISWVMTAAAEAGVEVATAAPESVLAIWKGRDAYWTPESKMRREERKDLLRRLGFV